MSQHVTGGIGRSQSSDDGGVNEVLLISLKCSPQLLN